MLRIVAQLTNLCTCAFRSFPNHFDEGTMFAGGSEAQKLKEEFRQHFRNISVIMDCVGCDKCKLWGKLQVRIYFFLRVSKVIKVVSSCQ